MVDNIKIQVAAHPLSVEVIEDAQDVLWSRKGFQKYPLASWTPEAHCYSYARLSRDPRPPRELRLEALETPEKMEGTIKRVTQKLGHKSIAEHASVSFDIENVSRLLIEDIENFRLCAYTEKSQRYITLGPEEFIIPKEFVDSGFDKELAKLNQLQAQLYGEAFELIHKKLIIENPDKKPEDLEGAAKEDARYIYGLNTRAQLGMTPNARELEHIIRRFRNHPLEEGREFGTKLYQEAISIVPHMIAHADPEIHKAIYKTDLKDDFYLYGKSDLEEAVHKYVGKSFCPRVLIDDVILIEPTFNGDMEILASMIFSNTNLGIKDARNMAEYLLDRDKNKALNLLKCALKNLSKFDAVFREFEMADLTYQFKLSASAYAQLKRHRMMTLITKDLYRYDPGLGYTIPQSIKDIWYEDKYREVLDMSTELFKKAWETLAQPKAAYYALSNAHNRLVVVKANIRELYHISRMRVDLDAQWDIREKAKKMVELAKEAFPMTTMLLGGKHEFADVKAKLYRGK